MGMAAAATARRNKLKRNADWRAGKRVMSELFRNAEKYSLMLQIQRIYQTGERVLKDLSQ